MDVSASHRKEPLRCKSYRTRNLCFQRWKAGGVGGDGQNGWMTARWHWWRQGSHGCFSNLFISVPSRKSAFHKNTGWEPISAHLDSLIPQQWTIWGPSNAWEMPRNCGHWQAVFANSWSCVSTCRLRTWSKTLIDGLATKATHFQSRRKCIKKALRTPVAEVTVTYRCDSEVQTWPRSVDVTCRYRIVKPSIGWRGHTSFVQGQCLKSLGVQSFLQSSVTFFLVFAGLCLC